MWDLPGPGLEPVSHALPGGFSTTASPGKSPEGKKFEACSRTSISIVWNMFDDVSCEIKIEKFSRKYKLVHG